MTRSRVSVALCTYNGEAYLDEQLSSIVEQTRLPDEIVICDDHSSDSTLAVVDAFLSRSPVPVRTYVRESAAGVVKNFETAISRCSGDFIVLCDQDDVWLPDKLACMEQVLESNPDCGLVFHDLDVVDADLRRLGHTLWQAIGFDARDQRLVSDGRACDVLLKRRVVTGAGMMFRAKYREHLIPFPACWIHDAWIAMILVGSTSLICIPETLTLYRQHGSNLVGGRRKSVFDYVQESFTFNSRGYFEREIERVDTVLERLGHLGAENHEFVTALHAKRSFLTSRARYPEIRPFRVPSILANLQKYERFERGKRLAIRDLLRPAC